MRIPTHALYQLSDVVELAGWSVLGGVAECVFSMWSSVNCVVRVRVGVSVMWNACVERVVTGVGGVACGEAGDMVEIPINIIFSSGVQTRPTHSPLIHCSTSLPFIFLTSPSLHPREVVWSRRVDNSSVVCRVDIS